MKTNSIICSLFILLFSVNAFCTEYDRSRFKHWSDIDGNGLSTREDLLNERQIGSKFEPIFICPYTGDIISNPLDIQLDHVVSLKYAWTHGASEWTDEQREIFANDSENILLVAGYSNQSKSDKSPEEWLPPDVSFIDEFIDLFIYVCEKYSITYSKENLIKIKEWSLRYQKGIKTKEIINGKDRDSKN